MKDYISKSSALLVLTLVIVSCSKQEWKKTVSTEIRAQISENEIMFGNSQLTIDSLYIHINSFLDIIVLEMNSSSKKNYVEK